MNSPQPLSNDKLFLTRSLEATIRVGLVFVLVAWCFQIVKPFIIPIVWGMIIAIASSPGYLWLLEKFGGRRVLAATLFTLFALILLITPMIMLSGTIVDSAHGLSADLQDGTIIIPPPPASVSDWPIIGEPVNEFWTLASQNLQAALREIKPELKAIGGWLLSTAAGAGFGILQFVVAIIIAGAFLAHSGSSRHMAVVIANRLAGDRGRELAALAETTVRSVARGILGVALIQSLLAGLGFLAAGVPAAGIWALLCLLLSVVQIGVGPILIPVVIYVFSTADTITAVIFLIWSIFVLVIDNVLKPILLGRGVDVPMMVIFIGAIGGFIASGIIGLFVGAIVLVLGYKLFLAWLGHVPQTGNKKKESKISPPAAGTAD